jgi:DNA polymerase-3 subunit gamma/tau
MDVEPDAMGSEADFFTQDGPGLFAEQTPVRLDDEPLALYRRYRPEVFDEVIGQEHITDPLKRALTGNRVNHAYLFSGPRGCGKTSSARILARSLNCAEGPTPTPCGTCQSCRDLARGGPGSLDVIEIDAASHGGVDDARDLRERAFFAPVQSRYKVYIVDEAHQVTSAGFNALLKLVEEPPPHVKFIFATTEPDKVIGTIRSRTHHYPFRLIPPKTLAGFLTNICAQEGIAVETGVISMVVRAGAGSVRDCLSVLDQLFGGATAQGVSYAHAAALLGYTPDSLLDSVVDALVAQDAAGLFAGIDKVIETGHDPRRFTEDLLTRLRDLVIVAAVPNALASGMLADVADDQGERFKAQVAQTGVGTLIRAAEVLAAGLVAMRGTTAPRLHLELLCARILLPGADAGDRGLHARLERLERRLESGGTTGTFPVVQTGSTSGNTGTVPVIQPAAAGTVPVAPPVAEPASPRTKPSPRLDEGQAPKVPTDNVNQQQTRGNAVPTSPDSRTVPLSGNAVPTRGDSRTVPAAPPVAPPVAPVAPVGDLTIEVIRRRWAPILSRVSASRRYVWMILNQYATDTALSGTALWVTFRDGGARENFNRSGGEEHLAKAIQDELGVTLLVRGRLDSEPIPADGRTAILSLAKSPAEPADQTSSVPKPPSVPSPEPPSLASVPAENPAPSKPARANPGREARAGANPGSAKTAEKPTPAKAPDPEPDAPSEDDLIIDNPADLAADLVMELFDAELVKEEQTKPRTRKKT